MTIAHTFLVSHSCPRNQFSDARSKSVAPKFRSGPWSSELQQSVRGLTRSQSCSRDGFNADG